MITGMKSGLYTYSTEICPFTWYVRPIRTLVRMNQTNMLHALNSIYTRLPELR